MSVCSFSASLRSKMGQRRVETACQAYEKPNMDIAAVEALLESYYGKKVQEISIADGGNLSTVFFFKHEGQSYVIRFSELKGAFEKERYISELLASQDVPYPRVVTLSKAGSVSYAISERIEGGIAADLSEEQRMFLVPIDSQNIHHESCGSWFNDGLWLD